MKPTIAALVPMRHDSERVPGKNYRQFLGKPLYEYILDTLQACPLIDKIVVDTDSPVIRDGIAKTHPKVTVIDRPENLRSGTIPMTDVLLHDVKQVEADIYVQTHSTNPLLTSQTVTRAIEQFLLEQPRHDSLFSATTRQVRLWDSVSRPVNHNPAILQRTQDLPKMYEENSCIYVFTRETLEQHHSRIGNRPLIFPMDRLEAIDIDEEIDFALAKSAYGVSRTQANTDDLYYFGHHKCATHWMRKFLKPVTRKLKSNYRVTGGKQPEDVPYDQHDRTFHLFVNSRTKDLRSVSRTVRGFHLMRDPRDCFVSNYFSRRYSHGINNQKQADLREYLNANNMEDGLIALLEDDDMYKQMNDWEVGAFPNVLEMKYEDLLQDEFAGFSKIVDHLGIKISEERLRKIIDKCSFKSLSGGRTKGEENEKHHYRKGVAGDWPNHMPPGGRVHTAFTERYGHLVSKFGYEEVNA